jgi:broad specificity phosphatase PhoE
MLPSDTCLLYLLRHGATANNTANPPILQGCRTNPPLSDAGIAQAEAAAKVLSGQQIDMAYCTPLLRSRQTAERIAAVHSVPVEEVAELNECDVGLWEGRSWVEIKETEPEAYQRFFTDPATHGYSGGENLGQVLARVRPSIDRLLRLNLGRGIVIVAHNAVNRVYLADLLGIPPARAREIVQDNGGVNIIRFRHGTAQVLTVNSNFHLT